MTHLSRRTLKIVDTARGTIPHRFTTKTAEILANIGAGVQQTGIDQVPGLEPLAMTDGTLRPRRVLPVVALAGKPDYFLVELETLDGAGFANVTISQEGWLLSIEDVRGLDLPAPIDLGELAIELRNQLGKSSTGLRYVYAPGTTEKGASPFLPLASANIDLGAVYVNSHREVFVTDLAADEKVLVTKTDTKRLRKLAQW